MGNADKEQQKTKEMKWINVNDSLPEEKQDVLVFERYMDVPFVGYIVGGEWRVNAEFYEVGGRYADGYIMGVISQKDVTHWMPLPEPPKQD